MQSSAGRVERDPRRPGLAPGSTERSKHGVLDENDHELDGVRIREVRGLLERPPGPELERVADGGLNQALRASFGLAIGTADTMDEIVLILTGRSRGVSDPHGAPGGRSAITHPIPIEGVYLRPRLWGVDARTAVAIAMRLRLVATPRRKACHAWLPMRVAESLTGGSESVRHCAVAGRRSADDRGSRWFASGNARPGSRSKRPRCQYPGRHTARSRREPGRAPRHR